jgi:hypothetical protein
MNFFLIIVPALNSFRLVSAFASLLDEQTFIYSQISSRDDLQETEPCDSLKTVDKADHHLTYQSLELTQTRAADTVSKGTKSFIVDTDWISSSMNNHNQSKSHSRLQNNKNKQQYSKIISKQIDFPLYTGINSHENDDKQHNILQLSPSKMGFPIGCVFRRFTFSFTPLDKATYFRSNVMSYLLTAILLMKRSVHLDYFSAQSTPLETKICLREFFVAGSMILDVIYLILRTRSQKVRLYDEIIKRLELYNSFCSGHVHLIQSLIVA